MLSEPKIARRSLIVELEEGFGLSVRSLDFLPIGSDARSFSYDCRTQDDRRFYLKLRLAADSTSESFSESLQIAGQVEGAIHALVNKQTNLNWMQFGLYKIFLFPFVSGVSGWDIKLTPAQWHQVGRTFRSLHDIVLSESALNSLPREDFSDRYRILASKYLNSEMPVSAGDICASGMQKVLRNNHRVISDIIEKAQELSLLLRKEHHEFVCCHGDLHSGNFLVAETGMTHPVDWDNLSLAPREKDLMFIGGGIGGMLDEPNSMELFRRGYGLYQISVDALRYFRFERIVQDVVAYCEQLLDSEDGGPDRAVGLEQFSRQFARGGVIDIAYQT